MHIFISRFRQVLERKRNIIVCVAALLVGFMIALSSSVFMNTSKNNLHEIESLYGKFDISITLNDVQNMNIVNQALSEYQYIIVQSSNDLNDEYNLLSSVLQAYQQTAISAVERQLKYDLMAYEEGGTSEEVLKYIENYEYSVIYEDIGKINSLGNVYLCGLAETNILDIYSEDIFELKKWDSKISENEIVVSKYVANIYGIEVGDIISILYGGKDYKLEVCNIINTNEISEIKRYFEENNNFVYMDITDVKEQWVDNTSAALEPMRLFAGVISVSLLGITLCMLLSANKEKSMIIH